MENLERDVLLVPVYVITGFLDAGKTTLLNTLLNQGESRHLHRLILQFELGEEEIVTRSKGRTLLTFPKRALEQEPEAIIKEINRHVFLDCPDEIWVEWNGMAPLAQLLEMFRHRLLINAAGIQRIVHISDGAALEGLLANTGGALPEQIAGADFAVLRNIVLKEEYKRLSRDLRSINPGLKVYKETETERIYKELVRKKSRPVSNLVIAVLAFCVLFFAASSLFDLKVTAVNTIINVFLGIMLQAVPFLLIGVLLSSAIQIFVSQRFIERRFPKNLGLGMLAALVGGFFLPVCDCASIPIFRSLVRKGIPLPVAVTFMTASPVINPVVILSTYYAFGGNLSVVGARVGLGALAAVLIGICCLLFPPRGRIFQGGFNGTMCSCGCYEGLENISGLGPRLRLFLRHSQVEFFDIGKYLLLGAFVSAVFQVLVKETFTIQDSGSFALALFVMMALAFVLSLCSSSDAVVARSFAAKMPLEATLGFLIFGPMMDIKNVIMLSGSFSKKFILRLLAITFAVCFLVVFFLGRLLIGG